MGKWTELPLAYVPLAHSEHVYINGAEARRDVDYTLENGSIVTIRQAADADDKVECRYAHLKEPGAPYPPPYVPRTNCGGGPTPMAQIVPYGPQTSSLTSTTPFGVPVGTSLKWKYFSAKMTGDAKNWNYKRFQFYCYFRNPVDNCIYTAEFGGGYVFNQDYESGWIEWKTPMSMGDYRWGLTADHIYVGWSYYAGGISMFGDNGPRDSQMVSYGERAENPK